jgi:hypothetical protein
MQNYALGPMSHAGTLNQAFLNKHAQSYLKPALTLVVKMWEVLFPVVVYHSYGRGMPEI